MGMFLYNLKSLDVLKIDLFPVDCTRKIRCVYEESFPDVVISEHDNFKNGIVIIIIIMKWTFLIAVVNRRKDSALLAILIIITG